MQAKTFTTFVLLAVLALTMSGLAPAPIEATLAAAPSAVTQSPQSQGVRMELVGQIGGDISAVAVQGDYAYIGVGPRLVVLDVSDPAHPTMVGQSGVLPGIVLSMAVSGNYVYVISSESNLHILDVSDPTRPARVGFGFLRWLARDVAVAGGYAYVAGGSGGLRIIDVADPAHPVEVGFYDTPEEAHGVAVAGGYAYIADGLGGLRIINVSNPANPVETGFIRWGVTAEDVAIAGNYAYVTDSVGGVRIINVSDPVHPTQVGSFSTWRACSIAVAGNYVYVADRWAGLRVVNVSDPTNPTPVGFLQMPAEKLVVEGNYVYVTDGAQSLYVINVSDPANPDRVSVYDALGPVHKVAVARNYVYAARHTGGLYIINSSGPDHLAPVGSFDIYATDMVVAGFYAYVVNGQGLHIISISDPTHPVQVGSYNAPKNVRRSITVEGNYAYIAEEWNGLRIVDISDPANPTPVGFWPIPAQVTDVAVAGNYAYITSGCCLRIINVADPTHPTEVGFHNTGGSGIAVAGNYAYVAGLWSGLRIIKVSDPAHPVEVSRVNVSMFRADDVEISGTYVYVADGGLYGLRIINVADPYRPMEVGFYRLFDLPFQVAVDGNYVYLANRGGGLVILRTLRDKVTGSIPPEGGILSSTNGDTEFVFPIGAFTQTVTLVYRHLLVDQDTGPLLGVGHTFEVTAVYSDTNRSAQLVPGRTYTLTIRYTDVKRGPAIEATLALYYWDGSQWVREPSSAVDPEANIVIAHPDRMGTWAVLGETRRIYLPVAMSAYR